MAVKGISAISEAFAFLATTAGCEYCATLQQERRPKPPFAGSEWCAYARTLRRIPGGASPTPSNAIEAGSGTFNATDSVGRIVTVGDGD